MRPQLEYAAAAWNPHDENDIRSLEAIQRQAVRFIYGEYGKFTSITALLSQLDLDLLATRRLSAPCSLKSKNQFINLQFPPCVKLLTTSGKISHQLRYITIQRHHKASMLELYHYGIDYPRLHELTLNQSPPSRPWHFRW